MGNMSYCRFENTAMDLEDCANAILDGDFIDYETTSDSEIESLKDLIEYCKDILDQEHRILDEIDKWEKTQEELF